MYEQLREYESWAADNSAPLLQSSLLHRKLGMNMLVAVLWSARYWEEISAIDATFLPPAGAKRLLNIATSLAILELHAGPAFDSAARGYLRQRLQAPDQIWGAIHECETFAHFIQRGAEVEPRFLVNSSPDELTVRWEGRAVPVQCKSKKPGAGRAISQEAFTTLGAFIARDASSRGERLTVGIGSTGQIRPTDVEFLRSVVKDGRGRGVGPDSVSHQGRTFSIRVESLSGEFPPEQMGSFLSRFGFTLPMMISEPAPSGSHIASCVVGVDANLRETPWRSLRNSIDRGACQLKGGPPGIIAVHYADPVDDFDGLRPGVAPLGAVLGQRLHQLPHVAGVLLSSEPDLLVPGSGGPGNARFYGNPSLLPPEFPIGQPVI